MIKKYKVVCQLWEESESGWGTRPDGFSLHLNEEQRIKFIHEYCKDRTGPAPEVYDRPVMHANFSISVSQKVYNQIKSKLNQTQ